MAKESFECFLFRNIVNDIIVLGREGRIKFGIVVVPVWPKFKRYDALRVSQIHALMLGEGARKAPRLFDIEPVR